MTTKRSTTPQFISKAIKVHGDKFDYSKVDYVNSKKKIIIICLIHGEFEQTPTGHLGGKGCLKCALTLKHSKLSSTTPQFISKAVKVHGDKFDYSKVDYVNSTHNVTIICPIHGEFEQIANSHLQGSGCSKCGVIVRTAKRTHTPPRFISKAIKAHGDKFDYSKVDYVNSKKKIIIICPIHGEFEQTPSSHLQGSGCSKCNVETTRVKLTHTPPQFISKAIKVHGDKFDYSKVDFNGYHSVVTIICPIHGEFEQIANDHVDGHSCSDCSHIISNMEQSLSAEIANHVDIITSDRKLLKGKELDIIIPSAKIAIEFNGIYWHSEDKGKCRNYHINKTKSCAELGYRLIHIWEDDYNVNPDLTIKFILHAIGISDGSKIYARKTVVNVIDKKVAETFLIKYHIQSSVHCSIALGVFDGSELIGVATFTKRKYGYELVRFSTSKNIVGGLGKVSKFFKRLHPATDLISFCDLSRHTGGSYLKAGYTVDKLLSPDYMYLNGAKREHKFGYRRNAIKTKFPEIYSDDLSEREMMLLTNHSRVWDCGKIRFKFM